MLTITTEKQVIYINTNLLKSRVKKAILKLLKALVFVFAICSIFLILGTAGGSDLNTLTFKQVIFYIALSGIFGGIAYILNFIKNALQ